MVQELFHFRVFKGMLMIVGNPRICFASAGGDADGLAIMAQQDDSKDIKRDGRLQFSSQACKVGFCSAPFVSTGNDAGNTLNNGGFFYSGRLCLRFYLLPLSGCKSWVWAISILNPGRNLPPVLCNQPPKYNTLEVIEQ